MKGVVLGYRQMLYLWSGLINDSDYLFLGRNKEIFPHHRPAVANCNPESRDPYVTPHGSLLKAAHTSPDPNCTCGIYAYHDRDRREAGKDMGYHQLLYTTLVVGWGRIIYGTKYQWRAEFVQPVAISSVERIQIDKTNPWRKALSYVNRMAEVYDIPLITHDQIPLFKELYGYSWELPHNRLEYQGRD